MKHTINNRSGNKSFGTFKTILDAGDYINNKKAKNTFCNSNRCIPGRAVNTQNNLLLLKHSNYLNYYSCADYNTANLNINLLTTLDLLNVPVIQSNTTPFESPVDISLNKIPYLDYIIDPSGNLFGNNLCGIMNYENYLSSNVTSNINNSLYIINNYTKISNQYYNNIYTITGNTTLIAIENIAVNYICVGGGGGGGCGATGDGAYSGGGGGGGGGGNVNYGTIQFNKGIAYNVNIGIGGNGSNGITVTNGSNGNNSYIISIDSSSNLIEALGGTYGTNGLVTYGQGIAGGTGGYSQDTVGSTGGTQGNNGVIGGGGGGGDYATLYDFIGSGASNIVVPFYNNTNFNGFGGGGGGGGGANYQIETNPPSCGTGGYGGTSNGGGQRGNYNSPQPSAGTNGENNYGGGGGGGGAGDDANVYYGGNGGNGGTGVIIIYY
jgi:hypothetical protein